MNVVENNNNDPFLIKISRKQSKKKVLFREAQIKTKELKKKKAN